MWYLPGVTWDQMWATRPLESWTAVCPRWVCLPKPQPRTRPKPPQSSQVRERHCGVDRATGQPESLRPKLLKMCVQVPGSARKARRRTRPRAQWPRRHLCLFQDHRETTTAKEWSSTWGTKWWWASSCGTSSTECPLQERCTQDALQFLKKKRRKKSLSKKT